MQLKQLILSTLETLDKEQLRTVYKSEWFSQLDSVRGKRMHVPSLYLHLGPCPSMFISPHWPLTLQPCSI